jgi:hypothetical protein
MIKYLLLIVLFFLFFSVYAQETQLLFNESLICNQIDQAIVHLKKNKKPKVSSIRFDTLVRDGCYYDSFFVEYLAFKLKTEPEKVFEQKQEVINEIAKQFSAKPYLSGFVSKFRCINKKKRPNAIISKLDEDTLLIHLTTSRLGKEGSSGVIYLFIFNNGKIVKVYKNNWIE